MVALYNKISFVNMNVLTSIKQPWEIHVLQYLLIFVNKNSAIHCLFMLVHNALIFTNTFDMNNVSKCWN